MNTGSATEFNEKFQKQFQSKSKEIQEKILSQEPVSARKSLSQLQDQVTKNSAILTCYDLLAYKNVLFWTLEYSVK